MRECATTARPEFYRHSLAIGVASGQTNTVVPSACVELPRLKLVLPDRCPKCNTPGTARLQQTIRGDAILLNWSCSRCNGEWPIQEIDRVSDS